MENAWRNGTVSDRKFCLDCLPLLPETDRITYVEAAFTGSGNWLRITALRECALSVELPEGADEAIRELLILLTFGRTGALDRDLVETELRRLDEEGRYVRLRRVLARAPWITLAASLTQVATFLPAEPGLGLLTALAALYLLTPLYLLGVTMSAALPPKTAGNHLLHQIFGQSFRKNRPFNPPIITTIVVGGFLVMFNLLIVNVVVFDKVSEGASPLPASTAGSAATAMSCLVVLNGLITYLWTGLAVLRIRGLFEASFRSLLLRAIRNIAFFAASGAAGMGVLVLLGLAATATPSWVPLETVLVVAGSLIGAFLVFRLLAIPVRVVFRGVQTYRGHRRVLRAVESVRREDPGSLLQVLSGLRRPEEATAFLRRMRLRRDLHLYELDRAGIRSFVTLLNDPDAAASLLPPALIGSLGDDDLTAWRSNPDFCDELGRLEERLRVR
ncbi:hypothetical protein [Actinocorallia longicatena]|uniref:DUF2868 domain-containing protein n=1 Tax=Actinocorallia longicatena TaxID=111803 RepID=A0ABP6PZM9_9ACTN